MSTVKTQQPDKAVELSKKQSELYAQMIDKIQVGIVLIEPETKIISDVNNTAAEMIGAPKEQIIGKICHEYICPAEKGKCPITDLGQKVNNTERTLLTADGESVPVLKTVTAVRLSGKEYILDTFVDIVKRKKSEELSKENEEKFRAISDNINDSVIMIDNNGEITFWNRASEKLFGYLPEEAIGKDCHELIAPKVYHEDQTKGFSKFKNTGTGDAIGKTLRLTALKKDGAEFPVELSISPLKIKNSWHAVGILRDITTDIQAHEIQAEIITRFTTMINTVPSMMYLKDIENRYMIVNKLFCLNVSKTVDEIIGKTDYDLYPKEEAEKYHVEDKRVIEENIEIINEEVFEKDNQGEIRWLSKTKIPLVDNQNEVKGVVALIQDITEHHRNRDQLIQSDKLAAIGTLAAGVAHEINNPIGYINSNLNTMGKYLNKIVKFFDDNKAKDSEDNEYIKEIIDDFNNAVDESKEGTERVKKIVADLKSFSRVDRAEKENTDINDGIKSTLNIVWNELKYNCKMEKEFGDLPDLFCMPNQLNQVFMNLLINAGQSITDKSGLIKIKTWADDNNIYVSIKDNGCGISEKSLKKIFEPFFTTKEVGKGTGLGLSLVFDIIKKHNGKIDVKSEVGVGTEFIITLPLEGIEDA